jgi:hypothetical protein
MQSIYFIGFKEGAMPCPLAGYRIDEKAARIVAGFVVLLTVTALLVGNPWSWAIFLFLAVDFGVRALSRPRWSPLGRIAGAVLRARGVAPELRDAGPKRFAARIGLGFSAVLLVLTNSGPRSATLAVAAILLVCALLESLLGLCVGCQVWNAWYAIRDRISTLWFVKSHA